MRYQVRNSFLRRGGKKTNKKTAPLPPPMEQQKQGYLDPTRRGKSNDLAHHPIIQVFTAGRGWVSVVRAADKEVIEPFDGEGLITVEGGVCN